MSATETDNSFSIIKKPQGVYIKWLVHNHIIVADQSKEVRYFYSPNFEFCGAEWNIELTNTFGFFNDLYLMKKPSQSAVHANFILGVKNAHGSVMASCNYERSFGKGYGHCGKDRFFICNELSYIPSEPYSLVEIFCDFLVKEHDSTATVTASRNASLNSIKTLSLNFKELLFSGCNYDIKIKVKGKEFQAHQSVLVARSPVFRAMFQHNAAEKINGDISIQDCDPDSFHDFLLFVYSGDLNVISPNNAMSLYYTAKKYDLQELKKACSQCLVREMSTDSIFDVIPFATKYDESELLSIATEFFIKNADAVIESPKWQPFILNHLPLANDLFKKMACRCKKQQIS